ncbi:protein phosphatase 2C domain-containing protein [Delftia tsuruhatensis]|uniref:PP2C family protein-serine/threonine phosphatase n=1 Tax=Delftia tsuruhatensis TaxID=180282 RepID=UPI00244B7217|nr:serine/threonine-protein phosphatase [Delftia tsuruhatensis]MDH0850466.1 protein phosphatase 2C domain-containing protein [Delftia tsuruhatensis]
MSLSSFEIRLLEWFRRKTANGGMNRAPSLAAAVATDIGLVRDENQDRVAIARGSDALGSEYVVLALADGIGGLSRGADCAALTLASFLASIHFDSRNVGDPKAWLHTAAMRANLRVHREMRGTGGSTLVAALVSAERRVHWLSVGDSRVFVARRTEMAQISVDDTIAGQLGRPADSGLDQSNLLQFIGIGSQLEPHVDEISYPAPGVLALTSDGVHFLDPKWMGMLIARAPEVGQAARRLVENAKWCGGPDNASVALMSFSEQLAIPMAGAPSSVLQIWDPFSDLTLVGFPGADVVGMQSQSARVRELSAFPVGPAGEDLEKKSQHAEADPATPPKRPAKRGAKNTVSKRASGNAKTRRAADVGRAKAIGRNEEEKSADTGGDVPDFVIEFPNKAS